MLLVIHAPARTTATERDGIVLYELPGSALATPMPLTAADAFEMASSYLRTKLADVDRWLQTVEFQVAQSTVDPGFRKIAAFNLHQATETAYACFLLVRTLYFPRSHNIKFLRSLAEDKEPRLIEAWPRETRPDRRRFELVKRAYVEARYSASYEITADDLAVIATAVRNLRDIVERVSLERLDQLRSDAGL